MLYYATLCYTVLCTLWYTMVHYGTLWYTVVHYARLCANRFLTMLHYNISTFVIDTTLLKINDSGDSLGLVQTPSIVLLFISGQCLVSRCGTAVKAMIR